MIVAKSIEKKAQPIAKKLGNLKIVQKEHFVLAATLLKQLKDWDKQAKAEEDKFLDLSKQLIKLTKAHFKPFHDSVALLECQVKERMLAWQQKQQGRAKQLAANFEKGTGKITRLGTLVAAQEELLSVDSPAKNRKNWVLEITDANKIPRAYLIPDEVAIRAALKEGKKVAGCTLVEKQTIAI